MNAIAELSQPVRQVKPSQPVDRLLPLLPPPNSADPVIAQVREIFRLSDEMEFGDYTDDGADELFKQWCSRQNEIIGVKPTSLAGALSLIEAARQEFFQFNIEDHQDICMGDQYTLACLDGALALLREMAGMKPRRGQPAS